MVFVVILCFALLCFAPIVHFLFIRSTPALLRDLLLCLLLIDQESDSEKLLNHINQQQSKRKQSKQIMQQQHQNQQQRGNWSYMQASQELDRIIQHSDPSYNSSSTPCITHSYSNSNTAADVSCSICGHATAHFPIRSSSEVLGTSSSSMHTPGPAHSHSHSHINTPLSSSSYQSGGTSYSRDSRAFTSSMLKQSTSNVAHTTTNGSTNLTHSTNASRQLRHRLAPHPVAYPTSPLLHTSAVGSSGIGSALQTPENLIHIEAQSAANSVVSAFRELQAKTKMIESERTSACVVRDELKQELAEVRRKHGLSRNKDETRYNKHLQSIKVSTEEQVVSYNYTRSVYQQQQDIAQTQNHQVETLTQTQTQLAGDIEQLNSKIVAAEHRLRSLRENLITSRDQSNALEKVCINYLSACVFIYVHSIYLYIIYDTCKLGVHTTSCTNYANTVWYFNYCFLFFVFCFLFLAHLALAGTWITVHSRKKRSAT